MSRSAQSNARVDTSTTGVQRTFRHPDRPLPYTRVTPTTYQSSAQTLKSSWAAEISHHATSTSTTPTTFESTKPLDEIALATVSATKATATSSKKHRVTVGNTKGRDGGSGLQERIRLLQTQARARNLSLADAKASVQAPADSDYAPSVCAPEVQNSRIGPTHIIYSEPKVQQQHRDRARISHDHISVPHVPLDAPPTEARRSSGASANGDRPDDVCDIRPLSQPAVTVGGGPLPVSVPVSASSKLKADSLAISVAQATMRLPPLLTSTGDYVSAEAAKTHLHIRSTQQDAPNTLVLEVAAQLLTRAHLANLTGTRAPNPQTRPRGREPQVAQTQASSGPPDSANPASDPPFP